MSFALIALVVAGLIRQPSSDPFVAQHDAAVARNPNSSKFTIAVVGGRRSFRLGERIELLFVYDRISDRSRLGDDPFPYFADAVVDNAKRVSNPRADLYRAGFGPEGGIRGCVEGGVVEADEPFQVAYEMAPDGTLIARGGDPAKPRPKPRPKPPVILTMVLNEGLRFDVPGHYRLYMSDRHDQAHAYGPTLPAPIISNIVEFDIVRDDRWANETIDRAVAVLERSQDPGAREEAARTLRFVGSPRAIRAMATHLWRSPQARTPEPKTPRRISEARELLSGLFEAPRRAVAIAAMDARVSNPHTYVPRGYLNVAAMLRLTASRRGLLTDAQKKQAYRAYENRRRRVVPSR